MKNLVLAAAFLMAAASIPAAAATPAQLAQAGAEVVEHGGGCRKSSPPGQCCHMERATGVAHCH